MLRRLLLVLRLLLHVIATNLPCNITLIVITTSLPRAQVPATLGARFNRCSTTRDSFKHSTAFGLSTHGTLQHCTHYC
ncbi:hypothetical protein BDV98DRAFT_316018 [Pterulicium gracile]|uniref:Secreted protein n=1 Tax=Pterulicium gracile TaxID=1884261 RepID=A0A5C3QVL2_9AGAR|nr:hypothetical protein BDV98DRAFT_316018 [Pterula gracilis]